MSKGRLAILTATPDLIAQRLVVPLMQRLSQNGIEAVAALPRVFSEPEAFMLYRGSPTHPRDEMSRLHSNWLMPRLFTGGQSLTLFLRGDSGGQDLQEFVREMKGRSQLLAPRAEQLRGLSSLCDRNLSLVHSPDDDQGMEYEASLLFGPTFTEELRSSDKPSLPIWLFETIYPAIEYAPGQSPLETLPRVLQRAYCLMAADPQSAVSVPDISLIVAGLTSVCEEIRACYADDVVLGMWNGLASLVPQSRSIYTSIASCDFTKRDVKSFSRATARLQLSRVLCDCLVAQHFDPLTSTLLVRAMADTGSPVEFWEAQQLHVVASYHV